MSFFRILGEILLFRWLFNLFDGTPSESSSTSRNSVTPNHHWEDDYDTMDDYDLFDDEF